MGVQKSLVNQIEEDGLWVDSPLQGEGGVFDASIFDCFGRKLAGHSFAISTSRDRCRWNIDDTSWPKGAYVLVVKGERVLRQTMLKK